MNYIKKYSVLCCVINNDKVYPNIKSNTASRGRFLDYSLKLLIKQTIKGLIKEKRINPDLHIKLVVNIDEQTTKTNGYYNLKDEIIEELKYGIYNYNYGFYCIVVLKYKYGFSGNFNCTYCMNRQYLRIRKVCQLSCFFLFTIKCTN